MLKEFYNAAISASMDYWGVTGTADYLAQAGVSYATAGDTWQQKIEIKNGWQCTTVGLMLGLIGED
jgi:hypothetical protein